MSEEKNNVTIEYTGGKTDVAIKGKGHFLIGNFDGSEITVTRDGAFVLNEENFLVAKNGKFVLDKNKAPIKYSVPDDLLKINIESKEIPGELVLNALEKENVDIAKEFVEMMIMQKEAEQKIVGHLKYTKDMSIKNGAIFTLKLPLVFLGRLFFTYEAGMLGTLVPR